MEIPLANLGVATICFALVTGSLSMALAEEDSPQPAESQPSTIAASPAPPPSREQIAKWIAELDDDQYVVRERATGELLLAGEAVLDPLLATANGKRPEPADRAVWILRKLSTGKEAALRRPALERLIALRERPQVVSAAKEALDEIRHAEAAKAIKELSGRYVSSQYPGPDRRVVVAQVVLDDAWRGGDDGLKYLADLEGVRQVIVIGTDISAEGLAALKDVEELESLWLYGTKLKPEDKAAVQEALPRVTVDFRQGGLLGVGGAAPDGPGPAIVQNVQPGTAAAAAGIRVHDIIQTFNGQAVKDFKDLTAKIAGHRAGDEVKLEILRGGEKFDLTVKLGQWSAEQILPHLEPQ
jgi:PDZ domain